MFCNTGFYFWGSNDIASQIECAKNCFLYNVFKMIKIKPYLNAHGYNAAVLDKLNINQPLN